MPGDKEMIAYLKWLKATCAKVYLEKGPRFAGIVMAGFLGKIRFQVDTSSPAVEGFQWTLASWDVGLWEWHFDLGFLQQALKKLDDVGFC